VLSDPSIQVFEKKPKEPKPEAEQWERFDRQVADCLSGRAIELNEFCRRLGDDDRISGICRPFDRLGNSCNRLVLGRS
jgi:hypothetical protein